MVVRRAVKGAIEKGCFVLLKRISHDIKRLVGGNMKIYITGIAGMLGYGIYRALCSRADITGIDMVDIQIPELTYQVISLLDMEAVEIDIEKNKPDILIHTAAMVNVDECEEKPETAKCINEVVTEQLAMLCDKHGIKMIYISTDAVFDGENPELYTETDMPHPLNVYGETKLGGERAVLRYPKNLVFRTNIYGINIQKKVSFGEWIYFSLLQGRTLRMFCDIDFSPVLAEELAELIYGACQKKLCGLYHACGTGCITKYDFAKKMKEIFELESGEIFKVTSDSAGLKAKRAKHMGMSNKKLTDALNRKISTPEESIRQFYHLCRKRKGLWK